MTAPAPIRVTVLLFAAAREAAGTDRLDAEFPAGTSVGEALRVVAEGRPALAAILPNCRAAQDEEFAPRGAPLRDGAVLAVLPPVSGG